MNLIGYIVATIGILAGVGILVIRFLEWKERRTS